MRLDYDPQTDSLYIHLSDAPARDSLEVGEGVVVDVGAQGQVVGIDIQHASRQVDLRALSVSHLPLTSVALAA
ncbi:MAG: DUF2283 domain-containing protein [Tepidimonas ignava]|uniref:Uncharacterized protein YuzE n=1 Tax=Tepidimonas ignava TaxID=114249 RepID=A0A4V2UWJ0_9BURK|nr:DUF2283 domain-containing protein [Tepidimonas ignava]MCX7814920.1 DUF2283 domain-containing protein [Tepidimonas ignava]TCS99797.1 uncharacterized protein YuzE [Tepidimonas ignava]TSE23182.1 hypothetical protein Tigna_00556 [Tepidimonas ignava]